jgi:hypothetical protein
MRRVVLLMTGVGVVFGLLARFRCSARLGSARLRLLNDARPAGLSMLAAACIGDTLHAAAKTMTSCPSPAAPKRARKSSCASCGRASPSGRGQPALCVFRPAGAPVYADSWAGPRPSGQGYFCVYPYSRSLAGGSRVLCMDEKDRMARAVSTVPRRRRARATNDRRRPCSAVPGAVSSVAFQRGVGSPSSHRSSDPVLADCSMTGGSTGSTRRARRVSVARACSSTSTERQPQRTHNRTGLPRARLRASSARRPSPRAPRGS